MRRLICAVVSCSVFAVLAADLPQWSAPEERDHLQLGQALDTAAGEWIDAHALADRLAGEPYVLIGEKHDNPDHHALQLWLLEQLHAQRPQGSLLLEMLVPAQQEGLDAARQLPELSSQALQTRLNWNAGWPWALYGDLVQWGLREPKQLIPANLDRDEISRLYRGAVPPMPEYDAEQRGYLEQTIIDAHCGKLPASQIPAMLAIQYARDRRMAETLSGAATPALLIAGSFHARKDVGLPLHWPKEPRPVVVMLVEAGAELPSAEQADYLWLTPAMPATDYCESW
ncbi:ChaN family lipoprotein [Halopseudomonas nanhaiensis]|uniref:ChaN family lipoprotein n=1 Tax=Halopseudomonas nanhaiensis TaxID=2830842 RepID=UPI001CC1B346|nr:ChaN family lipoprotein [Halopseudomonas nanhaiensis]UAW97949.1 ChaN family lipoprotein [Halopseudomonas nanhaiensis]